MEVNLADLHERLAEQFPERECLVQGTVRRSWGDVTDRSRRVAAALRSAGLGAVRPRQELPPWETGQDHVALVLHNGVEHVEVILGAFKARTVPCNVNFRYTAVELEQLFADAQPRAVVYHARYGPVLAEALRESAGVHFLLRVEDGSGAAPVPGSVDYEAALAAVPPEAPQGLDPDDCYMLYTGGTTGSPKGVIWRQADIFVAGMGGRDDVVERAVRGGYRLLPLPPLIHGASQWMVFTAFHLGGTIVFPARPDSFDADDVWDVAEREAVTAMSIVGDAFGRPLLDALDRSPRELLALRTIANGGAALSPRVRQGLTRLLPHVRLRDTVGSSEAGTAAAASSGDGLRLNPAAALLDPGLQRRLRPDEGVDGWLATRGRLPLGYLRDPERTARTFPVVDGVRYAVPGDRARLRRDGTLQLLGRDGTTVNSGGEKVFVEEVEQALLRHPLVYDAVVVGRPSERWGQELVAVVAADDSLRDEALLASCGDVLARYKLPKDIVRVLEVRRSPSGKADYRWASSVASHASTDAVCSPRAGTAPSTGSESLNDTGGSDAT